jgi:hypothetical protein
MKYIRLSIGFAVLLGMALQQPLQDYLSGNLLAAPPMPTMEQVQYVQTIKINTANRLADRLDALNITHPTVDVIADALESRQELLKQSVTVDFTSSHQFYQPWHVSLSGYPQFIGLDFTETSAGYSVHQQNIANHIQHHFIPGLTRPVDSILESVEHDSFGSQRATSVGFATVGDTVDELALAEAVTTAFNDNTPRITADVQRTQGAIINASNKHFPELTLLSSGKSDFTNSTWGRSQNVMLALNDRVNNIVVEPGEEFSFNSTLKGPVTLSRGWSSAKIIYGGELRDAPGGGICQGSTTVYRAILGAGLPVTQHKAHSKYVYYYEQGDFSTDDVVSAVGIDSAIYPPERVDLKFYNDTPGPILIQATTVGKEAFVSFYGVDDGRTTTFDGPYFDRNTPAGFFDSERGRSYLRSN